MGYIIYLIDSQDVSDWRTAEEFIANQRDLPASDESKFAAFVDEITKKYPDLSDDDEDGENNANLWEEGIDRDATWGRVKQLVVKVEVTDKQVVDDLISAATMNDLKLYDSEGQVLHP